MKWYIDVLKKYAVFRGRARRKEYWMFLFLNVLIAFLLGIIDGLLGLASSSGGFGLLSGLYTLATLLPGISVGIRRLHDTNRSGWWLLISLVPLIGAVILIVFMAQDGQPEENQYGGNPKTAMA